MYTIRNIVILESNLKRQSKIDFSKGKLENKISIETQGSHDEEGRISVELSVTVKGFAKDEQDPKFEAYIKATGAFVYEELEGDSKLDIEYFKRFNGPAIIFPFVREHISSLAMKAGLGQVLLQPVDFTIHNKIKEEEK